MLGRSGRPIVSLLDGHAAGMAHAGADMIGLAMVGLVL